MNNEQEGWIITRQVKSYGQYVRIHLGDTLEIELQPNPMALLFQTEQGARFLSKLTSVEPTRRNADKIGFLLAQLFEMFDGKALTPMPPPARIEVLAPVLEWSEADLLPEDAIAETVIHRAATSSPWQPGVD